MKKSLNDLTKDDWNTLFPVELVDHNPEWKNIYENEKERIIELATKFKNDRGSYIHGKTDFVNETLDIISGKARANKPA